MSNQSLYTAAAGLRAQQQNIDTLANNIANIDTAGFKRSRVDFADAVYTAMSDPSKSLAGQTQNLQLGHGVLAQACRSDFSIGQLTETGRNLDFALASDGFFAVSGPAGQTLYTRAGNFEAQADNGQNVLVTSDGRAVLDQNGERISATGSLENLTVDSLGNLELDGEYIATLGIHTFSNPQGLEAAGGSMYTATDLSGQAQVSSPDVRQGSLERSNTNLSEDMSDLISAQRAYAFLSRAISTADEMRQIENNIRR